MMTCRWSGCVVMTCRWSGCVVMTVMTLAGVCLLLLMVWLLLMSDDFLLSLVAGL